MLLVTLSITGSPGTATTMRPFRVNKDSLPTPIQDGVRNCVAICSYKVLSPVTYSILFDFF